MDKLTLPEFNDTISVWKMETIFEFQGLMNIVDETKIKPENVEMQKHS